MPMSPVPPSEGQTRGPKAPRSRTRHREERPADEVVQEPVEQVSALRFSSTELPDASEATPTKGTAKAPAKSAKKSAKKSAADSAAKSAELTTAGESAAKNAAKNTAKAEAKAAVRSALLASRTSRTSRGAAASASTSSARSATSHEPELFDVEAFGGIKGKEPEAVASTGKNSRVTRSSGSTAAQAARDMGRDLAASKNSQGSDATPEQSRSTSRFGRWRVERERQRVAEIEKERERARHERLRQDPGLDGLRADERPHKERMPLTRARKMAYTAIVLGLVAVLYVVLVFFSPLLATRTITVKGASLLETAQVEQKLESLRGVPLTRIDEKQVRELIGQENVIRSVQVESRPPHELVVTLKERAAIAIIKKGDTYHTVDSDGVTLVESTKEPSTSVPLVRFGGDDPQTSAEFRTISEALSAMPSDLLAQVKEASASSTSSITFTLRDNATVQWGTAQESELKAQVLLSLRQAVARRAQEDESSNDGSVQKVSVYDVSAPRLPVTR